MTVDDWRVSRETEDFRIEERRFLAREDAREFDTGELDAEDERDDWYRRQEGNVDEGG